MTERELEQRLRAWYQSEADAAGPAPMDLQTSVSAIPDAMPSRTGLFGSRRSVVLLAAAAMLVALLVGGAIAVGAGLIPWLTEEPDEIPLSVGIPWEQQPESNVNPGTYTLDFNRRASDPVSTPIRVTFTLPAGWERIRHMLIWGQTTWFGIGIVDNAYVDPCHLELGYRDPPIGPTPADLAAVLPSFPGWKVTATSDVILDGYHGKHVKITAPADTAGCTEEDPTLLPTRSWPLLFGAVRSNEPMELWILDVQGTRLVIHAGSDPEAATAADLAELQAVIDSIRIDPLPPE
jgi:hypothetical protein